MALQAIPRRSLADGVLEQLRAEILGGERAPGALLPTERELCAAFGVNRGAVREALKRLEQMRLVAMQQGGRTRVADFREAAGLEILPGLVQRPDGRVDPEVVRSLVEARTALGADAARLAAARRRAAGRDRLRALAAEMAAAGGELEALQRLSLAFWRAVVESSGNVAYRLAFNSLEETALRFAAVLRPLLAAEYRDAAGHAALAEAIARRDAADAEARARALVRRGARGFERALAERDRETPAREQEEAV